MNTLHDFNFYSPLPVSEALNRLAQHPAAAGTGTFYGTVQGNYFDLLQNLGAARDPGDDPRVTGYIKPEGSGCRVYARAHAPEAQEYGAKMGLIFLVFMAIFMAYVFWDDSRDPVPVYGPPISSELKIISQVSFLVLMTFGGWRILKKFQKTGKFETMEQFKKVLDA